MEVRHLQDFSPGGGVSEDKDLQAVLDEIGYRLAGLADGEGCFSIQPNNNKGWLCSFVIKMRADDRPLLERFQRLTGVGNFYTATKGRHNPCVSWAVQDKAGVRKIVDIFDMYPLWSKKKRDYNLWRLAVLEWEKHEYGDSWRAIERYAAEIKRVRIYREVEAA
jgi:hypothetical protein